MVWFNKKEFKNIPELPTIDEISSEVPAVSEYLDAFRLPSAFKQGESDTLPVIDVNGNLIGIVSEYDLAKVLPEWSFEDESYRHKISVGNIMTRDVRVETEYTNIKNILSSVHEMHIRVIPIVDNNGRYTGKCITRSTLISYLTRMVKPRTLGGLATPLGVYLTDGHHQAGAKNPGLISTGMVLAGIIILIQLVTAVLIGPFRLPESILLLIQLILFVFILRLTPLVRFHAAEHQTIHAIEKGLPLNIDTVKMQPRAHKRCGTNLMVLIIGIQLVLIMSLEFVARGRPYLQLIFLVIGFIFVFSYWRKFGMWLQEKFTTAPASNIQIENAIKAGEELLRMHKEDTNPNLPGFLDKVWNMGIIQILASFLLTLWLFNFILQLL